MKYRKYFIALSIIAVLALDWAALDDITTSYQPNYNLEYAILLLSVPLLVFFAVKLRQDKKRK